jgi:hypothetical protein
MTDFDLILIRAFSKQLDRLRKVAFVLSQRATNRFTVVQNVVLPSLMDHAAVPEDENS